MRRWIIPVVIGLLALAAVGVWGYNQQLARRDLENYLGNKYRRAFFDMAGQVQNVEVLLSKSLVAADPRLESSLLNDIRMQANFAQSNLGQLPLNDALAGRTSKFLTQVGDYADSMVRQINQGQAIDGSNWDTLNSLYQQSTDLNRELQGMQYQVTQNNLYFGELLSQVRNNLQKQPDNLAVTNFQAMDKQMQQYPTLIYDGPFSEHLEKTEPAALGGEGEVSAEEAKNRALAYIDKRAGVHYQATVTGDANGRIPAYRVEVNPGQDGGDTTQLDVSRIGGQVIWMLQGRKAGQPVVDIEQARRKALGFLKDRGFGEMRSTYHLLHGNFATFNCAALQDGVTIYPDLVKVTVALDNGEVTGLETSGYLMSHRKRDLPKPSISQEQARAAINPRFEVSGGKLALIPVGTKEEKLTYEFQGKLGQESYLIYVNALNGREENILKLIDTPGGTLTM
ncbi:Sporulation protein YpeB [Pelotomaculum schinkii]|uniref:Sporulation protein YpeB n=1 Tax=Pelotomaculum schinkii TaxID=78350 RepID=A0A4Y7R619_9FIRM|nr:MULTISPECIES: germination protein YpeB [Pelotomaculum]TEB04193.1 Sporulation protein YpeB [Pelotomaculum schinkii]TEB17781.1 Sporulation protein YpeB [Pelotomaculum sp. FP]